MHKRNEQTFSDIVGVHIIPDDMVIVASDGIEHDEIVRKRSFRGHVTRTFDSTKETYSSKCQA